MESAIPHERLVEIVRAAQARTSVSARRPRWTWAVGRPGRPPARAPLPHCGLPRGTARAAAARMRRSLVVFERGVPGGRLRLRGDYSEAVRELVVAVLTNSWRASGVIRHVVEDLQLVPPPTRSHTTPKRQRIRSTASEPSSRAAHDVADRLPPAWRREGRGGSRCPARAS